MPKKPLPAAASGLPKSETETCPVAALAVEFNHAIERENVFDDKTLQLSGAAKIKNLEMFKAISDHRDFIEEQASRLPVKSGLGALFQISLLRDAGHDLVYLELSEERKNEVIRRIDRLAYSLFAFIEASTSAKLGSAGREFYMPECLNPHRQLAEAFSGAKEA